MLLSTKWIFEFYEEEAFPTQLFRYNGNSHIRLIRSIMLLSRQRVITRQQKNTKEVPQFFFNANMVFVFFTICIKICKISSVKNVFHSSNVFDLQMICLKVLDDYNICKWSWESRTYIIDKVGGFLPFLVFPSFLAVAQVLHPGCHCLQHSCIRTLLQLHHQA